MSSDEAERAARHGSAGDPDPANQRIGTVVDRYTIVRLLGQGGMGAVYEARHATLARRFAIKFLLPALAANREALRRFENEAKAAGGLEHPNLVAVTDLGRAADGAPYLVMEFLEGSDCAALLHRAGALPIARAVSIVLQACRGLAVAHRAGIVHRDLKPENLFLCDAGDGSDLVKVLDFGIAKLRPSEAGVSTGTGTTFGTAYYMSPEQARGAGDIDQRADVWSLGVVLYELLAGRRPFEGGQFLHVIHDILTTEPVPLAQLRPDLPAGLTMAVSRAMAKDASQRTASVHAWAELLAPFAETRPSFSTSPAAASARTVPTPATNLGPPPNAVRDGAAGDARAASLARRARRGGVTRWAVSSSAVAVVAAVVWLGARNPGARRPPGGAPAPAPAVAAPASVVPVAPRVPPAGAPASPATPPPVAPPGGGRTFPSSAMPSRSNTFEHPARRPIKRPAPAKPALRPAKNAAAHDEKPADPQNPADHPAIEIERDNPYRP